MSSRAGCLVEAVKVVQDGDRPPGERLVRRLGAGGHQHFLQGEEPMAFVERAPEGELARMTSREVVSILKRLRSRYSRLSGYLP